MIRPEQAREALPPVDLATLDLLPDPAWITGPELGFAYFNAAWLETTGSSARVVTSEEFHERLHPDDVDVPRVTWQDAAARACAFSSEFRMRLADGTHHWFLMRATPVHSQGAIAGWLAVMTDIDAERRSRDDLVTSEARARTIANAMPQLIWVTTAAGRVISVNETLLAYTGKMLDDVRDNGWTSEIHPDDLEGLLATWNRAVERGDQYETQYRLRRFDGAYRWMLNKATPFRNADGVILGWIGTATDIEEQKRAEDALRIVVDASSAFAETLDASVALKRLAEIAATYLADWCGVYIYDAEARLKPVTIVHRDPSRERFARDYLRRCPIGDADPIAIVASSGVPLRIDSFSDEIDNEIDDPEQRSLVRTLGLRACLHIPLGVDSERFGVFSLAIAESDRRFTDEDQQLATLLAQRASIAVGNARLYERQREVARTLQASFLPPALPHADGVQFDAVYAPGTRDLTIGGDWYDAFAFADGTIAFSIGDVAGHGLDAAVPMGKTRQTFRALAVVETDPARALAGADSVLRREHPDVFVTAIVGTYDTGTGALRYANAGHPPPFVRAQDGSLTRLDAAGVPLGLGMFDALRTRETALAPGDLLVAFTDGLIETTRDIEEGERILAKTLAHPAFAFCSDPAKLLRARILPQIAGDDVAILTLRAGGGADWTFDANDAHAAQTARRSFLARLVGEGIGKEERLGFEMVFGEIVGNVARYTPGTVDLILQRTGNGLVLSALDRGPGFAWDGRPPRDAYAERGRGLFLIETLARGVHIERIAGYGTYLAVTLTA